MIASSNERMKQFLNHVWEWFKDHCLPLSEKNPNNWYFFRLPILNGFWIQKVIQWYSQRQQAKLSCVSYLSNYQNKFSINFELKKNSKTLPIFHQKADFLGPWKLIQNERFFDNNNRQKNQSCDRVFEMIQKCDLQLYFQWILTASWENFRKFSHVYFQNTLNAIH